MGPGATSRPMKQAAAGDSYNALALELGWAGYCDSTLQFDSPQFTELAQLWQSLRGDAVLPKRDAMTARRLKELLPAIALYERFIAPDGSYRHRVRLEGMRFVRIYGTHTGQVVQDYLPPPKARRFCAGLDTTLEAMTPMRFLARTDSADVNFLSAEFCTMPLADNQGNPTMVMICAKYSAIPWEAYIEAAMDRLAQAKSLAKASRDSELSTAI